MMLSLGPLHPVVVMRRGAEGETGGGWWEKKKVLVCLVAATRMESLTSAGRAWQVIILYK